MEGAHAVSKKRQVLCLVTLTVTGLPRYGHAAPGMKAFHREKHVMGKQWGFTSPSVP